MIMIKLLIEQDLEQRIVEVRTNGKWLGDSNELLWDERLDGLLTELQLTQLGGLVRNGSKLDFDQTKKDISDADKLAKQTAKDLKKTNTNNLITSLEAGSAKSVDVQLVLAGLLRNA